jgi:threonylcarbamoyladenosine tRNA methylthiotransferase MtaB
MIQPFLENGYEIVDFEEYADIYIINTCTVTNMSDRKSRQMIRRAKDSNPNSLVVAVGCYAQVLMEKIDEIPEIDLALGTNKKNNVVEIIENYINDKDSSKTYIDDVMHSKEYGDFGSITYTDKTRAVIKVQDGCDRFCSYCIIPFARGVVRSRNPQNVYDEISMIASQGIKEVVITGIHVASYGKDFKNRFGLIDLLEKIHNIPGIERIRLGSIEPLWMTNEVIERLSKLNKICHQFHLSLQSGCDDTLKRMNRRYTTNQFEEIVNNIRHTFDDAILTTDIIVGFAGETDEEFEQTYNFLKKINFYKMHIFKYSPRKGTKAENMPNQVDGNIKEFRSKKLIELSYLNEINYLKSYIGKKISVLWEEEKNGVIKGHTPNYLLAEVSVQDELLANQIVNNINNVEVIDVDEVGLALKCRLNNN